MSKPIIYLCGYGESNTALTLKERAEELDALVIDVRFQAWSDRPEWRKPELTHFLGHRYFHVPEWGNRHYRPEKREKGIIISDFEKGVSQIRKKVMHLANSHTNPVRFSSWFLLCRCRAEIGCHRGLLGKKLREEYKFTVRPLVWRPEVGVVSVEEKEFTLV